MIGSGPGGAITAALLAEGGRDVVLIEEGPHLELEDTEPFSIEEMRRKYRNGGVCSTLGSGKIAWAEGRCVGGGSEVNSGLYFRTPGEILDRWQRDYGVERIACTDLEPHFQACEQAVSVTGLPGPAPLASRKLAEGAEALRWKAMEVPRWFQFDGTTDAEGVPRGSRRSMTKTWIPRAREAGCHLLAETRVRRITKDSGSMLIEATSGGESVEIRSDDVFVCAGAVQTPALLRKSGLRHHIGNTLAMHPTVKLAARFEEVVNHEDLGVPVHQVKEFSPRVSFGCSISSRPYLGLLTLAHAEARQEMMQRWRHMAIYYAMTTGETNGKVRTLPWAADPLVRYGPSRENLRDLGDGLRRLGELLFAAGAIELYPSVAGVPPLRSVDQLSRIPYELPSNHSSLMTIHLFSSCLMGERDGCPADSFGKLREAEHIYLNDASLLPTALGVNPQGTIMAVAHRNAMHYLENR